MELKNQGFKENWLALLGVILTNKSANECISYIAQKNSGKFLNNGFSKKTETDSYLNLKSLTDEYLEVVRQKRINRIEWAVIAEEYGVLAGSLQSLLKRYCKRTGKEYPYVKTYVKDFSEEDKKTIINHYLKGASYVDLGKEFNCDYQIIKRRLRQWSIIS